MKNHKRAEYIGDKLPKCDFCDYEAHYDGRVRGRTSWAYMCDYHFREVGIFKLGLGYGQELILKKKGGDNHDKS